MAARIRLVPLSAAVCHRLSAALLYEGARLEAGPQTVLKVAKRSPVLLVEGRTSRNGSSEEDDCAPSSGRTRSILSGRWAGLETCDQLVLDCTWSPEQFERWLSAALVDLVLAN
jgi:hypothetical protein